MPIPEPDEDQSPQQAQMPEEPSVSLPDSETADQATVDSEASPADTAEKVTAPAVEKLLTSGAVVSGHKPPKHKFRFPRPEQLFPKVIRRKLGRSARPLGVLLLLVIIGLAGFGGWHYTRKTAPLDTATVQFHAKTVAFKVISTSPKENQLNVAPTSSITIQFSQPVNPQKLLGNLFLTPSVAGKYTRGKTSSQVVFTPNVPFAQGTKVQVMLNGTFQSARGSQLGPDLSYNFTTALPQDQVLFQDSNGLYETLSSAKDGERQAYTLEFGSDVAPGATVTLYKSDMAHLLKSLVYKNDESAGFADPQYVDDPIDTSAMTALNTQTGANNSSSFNVTEQGGIYLAAVTDTKGNQLGHVWIDYSDFGVLARQDDQKLLLDAQNFTDSSDVAASVTLYNLENGVNQLNQASVNGLTTLDAPYSPSVDLVVASDGTSQAVVPLAVPESQGEARVDQNLSTAPAIFGVTDKPTYHTSDTLKFSGYARANQDALYSSISARTLNLYVASYQGEAPLASFTANVDSNGMFSGSVPINSAWLNGGSNDQFQIYATSPSGNFQNDVEVASFTVTSQAQASSMVTVSFAKSSYLPTDTIQATIKATDASGNPLANAAVDVHTFSEDYYENNPTANLANFDNVGSETPNSPTTVQLNANGEATTTVNVSNLADDGTSQVVTVQAGVQGASGAGSEGGASAIVHQGNGSLAFGTGRNVVSPKSPVIGRIYASNLDGSPIANTTVSYALINSTDSNTPTVGGGTVTTDNNGYAQISTPVPGGTNDGDNLELKAWIADAQNNKIQAVTYYYYAQHATNDSYDTSGAALEDLDVSGSSGNVSVGQKVTLNINSPTALNAMITMDRGRIYNPQLLKLQQGDNNFSFTVSADLAPSFTLTINYFRDGIYHSEGVQFSVSNPAKQAALQLSTSGQTVSANTSTSVQVNAKDASGNPLQTNLIVSVVSASAYNLYSQVIPDMFTSLYPTLPIMTNSSSSLTNIATGGGGKCGGGGGAPNSFTNPVGTTLLWQPETSTDASGNATITFTPPKGSWRVNVYSMDDNTVVGSATTTITAN